MSNNLKEQAEKFVNEWRVAPSGPESFKEHVSKYPKLFEEVWDEVTEQDFLTGWTQAKEEFVKEVLRRSTKLYKAMK